MEVPNGENKSLIPTENKERKPVNQTESQSVNQATKTEPPAETKVIPRIAKPGDDDYEEQARRAGIGVDHTFQPTFQVVDEAASEGS